MAIIPNSERTHEQLVEMGRKGGLKAAENRRKRKENHECKYDDLVNLKQKVWSLAAAINQLAQVCDKYDDHTQRAKSFSNDVKAQLDNEIRDDLSRLYE